MVDKARGQKNTTVKMPEPDSELESIYGSEYGRKKPMVKKRQVAHATIQLRPGVRRPDPDCEIESLADFKSVAGQKTSKVGRVKES